MNKNDGGPAFPGEGVNEIFLGMTLRDWFAGQERSEPAFLTTAEKAAEFIGITEDEYMEDPVRGGIQVLAKWRYKVADAMLEARDER